MPGPRDFLVQLGNFEHEADTAALYVYADMTVKHAGARSEQLLNRHNLTPRFWLAHAAACQTAGYMALARIFDHKTQYNIYKLIDALEGNLNLFTREALRKRKCVNYGSDPSWLEGYLDEAYYPTPSDTKVLRAKVEVYKAIYEKAIQPARNKYLAHRVMVGTINVNKLFASSTKMNCCD